MVIKEDNMAQAKSKHTNFLCGLKYLKNILHFLYLSYNPPIISLNILIHSHQYNLSYYHQEN